MVKVYCVYSLHTNLLCMQKLAAKNARLHTLFQECLDLPQVFYEPAKHACAHLKTLNTFKGAPFGG